ncbi:MAG: hypothetical protein WC058_15540 [Phycisphaeraceae bacterium]
MTKYHYSGWNETGQPAEGELEAVNQGHALEKLRDKKIDAVSLTRVEVASATSWRVRAQADRSPHDQPISGWALIGIGAALQLVAVLFIFVFIPLAWFCSAVGSIFILAGVIRWAVKGAMYEVEQQQQDLHALLRDLYELEKSSR